MQDKFWTPNEQSSRKFKSYWKRKTKPDSLAVQQSYLQDSYSWIHQSSRICPLALDSFLELDDYGQKPPSGTQLLFRSISHSSVTFLRLPVLQVVSEKNLPPLPEFSRVWMNIPAWIAGFVAAILYQCSQQPLKENALGHSTLALFKIQSKYNN